jgi:hypothetical protein
MIDPKILEAIMAAPDIVPQNPELNLKTKNPLQIALLTYTCDVLLTELPVFAQDTGISVPDRFILSFVAERKHGTLALLARTTLNGKTEHDNLEDFSHNMKLKLACSALENTLEKDQMYYFEAWASLHMSSHARLDLVKRMHFYAGLV